MTLRDLMRMAFSNLWRRRLRSSLTIFAVVIGAALVSLMVSLGTGMQSFLTDQFRSMVSPEAIMVSSNPRMGQAFTGFNIGGAPREIQDGEEGTLLGMKPIPREDIDRIGQIEHVERIDPQIMALADWVKLKDNEKRFRTNITASPSYEVRMRKLAAGRHIDDNSRGVCIIANQYLEAFGWSSAEDALGKEIVIGVSEGLGLLGAILPEDYTQRKEYTFKIVGVTEKTLNSTEVIVPIEDAKEMSRFGMNNPDLYTEKLPPSLVQVKVTDQKYSAEVARKIKDLGLGAMTPEDILGMIGNVFLIIEIALSIFGIIALIVASLGIINTLIMAIYERTREIGIMKAVGASKGTIRLLFTSEGCAIGFLGGALGVAFGWAFGLLVNKISYVTFLKDFQTFNICKLPPWLVFAVIVLTTAIALLAALYPANRAANLDPVDALRRE